MIRNMQILFVAISFLVYQPLVSGAENAEGGQHQEDEAGHAAEGSEAREVHLTPEQRELLSVQTVTGTRLKKASCWPH